MENLWLIQSILPSENIFFRNMKWTGFRRRKKTSRRKRTKRKKEKKILTAWEKVEISRSASRPTSLDYIGQVFDEFTELHGDRAFRDDGAVVGGIAMLNDSL